MGDLHINGASIQNCLLTVGETAGKGADDAYHWLKVKANLSGLGRCADPLIYSISLPKLQFVDSGVL